MIQNHAKTTKTISKRTHLLHTNTIKYHKTRFKPKTHRDLNHQRRKSQLLASNLLEEPCRSWNDHRKGLKNGTDFGRGASGCWLPFAKAESGRLVFCGSYLRCMIWIMLVWCLIFFVFLKLCHFFGCFCLLFCFCKFCFLFVWQILLCFADSLHNSKTVFVCIRLLFGVFCHLFSEHDFKTCWFVSVFFPEICF